MTYTHDSKSVQGVSLNDMLGVPVVGPFDRKNPVAFAPRNNASGGWASCEPLSLRELLAKIEAEPPASKGELPVFNCGQWETDITRAWKMQENVNCLHLDFDNPGAVDYGIDDVTEAFGHFGVHVAGYTSTSHTDEQPKLRILVPLKNPIPTRDTTAGRMAYGALVSRANGILDGLLTDDDATSWKVGVAFKYGCASGESDRERPETFMLEGWRYIDDASEIEGEHHPEGWEQCCRKKQDTPLTLVNNPATEWQKEWAAVRLERMAAKMRQTKKGHRHNTQNRLSFTAAGYAARGAIAEQQARNVLLAAALEAGRSADRAKTTFKNSWCDGLKKPMYLPGDVFEDVEELQGAPAKSSTDLSAALNAPTGVDRIGVSSPVPAKHAKVPSRLQDPKVPMPTARAMLQDGCSVAGVPAIHNYRGGFWSWNGAHYREKKDSDVTAVIWSYLEQQKKEVTIDGQGVLAPFDPNNKAVAEVMGAFKAVTILSGDVIAPAWLNGVIGPDPVELAPVANGLLHLPTGNLQPPSPSFFTMAASTVTYDPDAPEPAEWLKFLHSVWPDDQESIDCLQEIFGYLLSGDTSQQKIPLIIGPKRSGKGTIAPILEALVGQDSVAPITLGSLAQNFGLAALIGKSVAIIADARVSGKSDKATITERLLSISGEDSQPIDRKHREVWHGQLGVRFVIMSNELPHLPDASGALAGRYLMLEMKNSFFGAEDLGLGKRLLNELSGIMLWARDGYLRLHRRGHFVPTTSSRGISREMDELSSPAKAFISDRCDLDAEAVISKTELFAAWRSWCEPRNQFVSTLSILGRNLRAAGAKLQDYTPQVDGDFSTVRGIWPGK